MGGDSPYQILNMPTSSKIAGTGGYSVSNNFKDPGMAAFNPSLIDTSFKGEFVSAWGALFMKSTDISYGYASYSGDYKKYNFSGIFSIINYGRIDGYDEFANSLGTLYANDISACFSASRAIKKWLSVGISVKPVFSYLANYSSYAIASDVGLSVHDSLKNINFGFVVRNAGFAIKPYTKGNSESLPFEVDLGYSHRLNNAPFKISITYRNLQKFNLSYESELKQSSSKYIEDTTNQKSSKISDFTGKFMKHIVIGTEILFGKRFYIAVGFNAKRRSELQNSAKNGLIGFTYGGGITISRFSFSIAHQRFNTYGGSTLFSLQCNINNFITSIHSKNQKITSQTTL